MCARVSAPTARIRSTCSSTGGDVLAGELQIAAWSGARLASGHSAHRGSPWGNSVRIAVDLSPEQRRQRPACTEASDIRIAIVTDGKTWERNLVQVGAHSGVHAGLESCISLWVSGLPQSATRESIAVWLDGDDLPAVYLSEPDAEGLRQINAMLPSGAHPGDYVVAVAFQDIVSESVPVRLA